MGYEYVSNRPVCHLFSKVQLLQKDPQVNRWNLHFMTVQVTYRDRGAYIPLLVESPACVG
jgi:hypothetical protein